MWPLHSKELKFKSKPQWRLPLPRIITKIHPKINKIILKQRVIFPFPWHCFLLFPFPFPFPSCTFCCTHAYQQPESWGILRLYPDLVVDSRLCQFLQPHHCVVGVACLENTFVLRQRSWIRGIPEACSPLEAWKSSPLFVSSLAVWL